MSQTAFIFMLLTSVFVQSDIHYPTDNRGSSARNWSGNGTSHPRPDPSHIHNIHNPHRTHNFCRYRSLWPYSTFPPLSFTFSWHSFHSIALFHPEGKDRTCKHPRNLLYCCYSSQVTTFFSDSWKWQLVKGTSAVPVLHENKPQA